MKLLPAFAAVLLAFNPLQAVGEDVPVTRQLDVGADYCAILRAFTDKADPRCPYVEAGRARAVQPTAGSFSKDAAPVEAPGSPPGYFIRFAFNSIALTPEYRAHLDRLAEVFTTQAMEGVCIKLVGHTDVVGQPEYNERLSRARAKVVEVYLSGLGVVSSDRLLSAGAGESRPLPGLPGEHPLNRRVEILAKARTDKGCV